MTASTRQPVYVAACGIASPWGRGMEALASGLREGRIATVRKCYEGAGSLEVGACDFIESMRGEDRSITLLNFALEEIRSVSTLLNSHVPPERRGVCIGVSKLAMMLYLEDVPNAHENFRSILPDTPARHTAISMEARGPLQTLSGACATALQNIIRGAEWIAYGDAGYVIAGATDAALTDLYLTSLVSLGAITRSECRPFDACHDGFTASEGAGAVILANEETLSKCGLTPLAKISGWAFGTDAYHATACDITGRGTVHVLKKALDDAGTTKAQIDLLGVHGTGTVLSDLADANALRLLYGDGPAPPVMSVKGSIGHLMAACGAAEFAASLVCLREQISPAVTRCDTRAEGCEHLNIAAFTKSVAVQKILKWNSGFGGQIAACVIEKP